ncbi:hypothetical protein E2C01_051270 [Portunus trituberculatus]|uniref:Uncharacterized protein n=1 Tax=Portunus trituberculatus TaxID=210409 RepID=A0A5B7GIM6_PORTR|nr:hypothetical protein [Portunus trituberculatus]
MLLHGISCCGARGGAGQDRAVGSERSCEFRAAVLVCLKYVTSRHGKPAGADGFTGVQRSTEPSEALHCSPLCTLYAGLSVEVLRISNFRWFYWLPYPWCFEEGYVITILEVARVLSGVTNGHFCQLPTPQRCWAGRFCRADNT